MSAQSTVDRDLSVAPRAQAEGRTIWLTGLPSAGKTTIARALAARLVELGRRVEVLDGDEARKALTAGLGFTRADRDENVRRIGYVADLLSRNGVDVVCAVISPFRSARDDVRARHVESTPDAPDRFVEVWVATPVDVCAERDVKGLYARQRAGEISGLTGVDDPYEAPHDPEIELRTDELDLDSCVDRILAALAAMSTVDLTDADLAALSASFENASADEIVRWAVDAFGSSLCLAASLADAVLIDVATRIDPTIEVVFLDTQYHFPETLATAKRVESRYKLQLRVLRPDREPDDLWRTDTAACCDARKVQPMARHLANRSAWMSGLRRVESETRRDAPIVERDARGLVKINPLATWTDEQVDAYIAEHDVPVNPLLFDGYPSIGCWPCTQRVTAGEDPRSGRWAGSSKTECGLHP